jgi:glycosyltransferase involved in cell wall biosynthesis
MRIVMADPSLFTGRYDDSLCAALAGRGHDVSLLGRPLRGTDAIIPQGYVYRPRFFPFGERLRGLLGDGRAGRIAKGADYALDAHLGPIGAFVGDVVHWQWLPFARLDARWLHRLRPCTALVHTVHNARPYHGAGDAAAAQGQGYTALLGQFDALIAHGPETRAALEGQGVDPARIHLVPHPPMRLATADEAILAAVPPPPPGRPRILFFGTIRPYKGLDLLVAAALDLWRQGLDFELAIVGKAFMDITPLLESVRAAGFGHHLVTDLGFLPEERLDAHLRRADIVVFPYRAIDSSGAFLSALHYGAAMVTSDTGMFARLHEAVAARFAAGSADGLAQALTPLLRDPALRVRAGAATRALGKRMSDWGEAARLTEAAYQAAIASAHARGVPA